MDKPTTKGVMWRLIVCVSLLCCSSEAQVTCKNENGAAVDWFIIYKVPRHTNRFTGLEYYYIDSTGARREPSSSHHINNPWGGLAGTLEPMFKPIKQMSDNFAFISYSDQPPGAQANSDWFGHSKGVVMMDRTSPTSTGVWLVHSTPQFPFRREANNFYPPSGISNAQTFLCVTFDYNQFPTIGAHLQYIRAYPFDFDVPVGFHQDLPDMMNIINWIQNPPPITDPNPFRAFYSHGGRFFISVTKKQSPDGDREVGDLYVTIANGIQSDVYVQSWPTQGDVSYCPATGFKVFNIESVKTNWGNWVRGNDHSKWCISTEQNKPLTCIGDVNRAESQYERSGGALCILDEQVRTMFYGLIETYEPCP